MSFSDVYIPDKKKHFCTNLISFLVQKMNFSFLQQVSTIGQHQVVIVSLIYKVILLDIKKLIININ